MAGINVARAGADFLGKRQKTSIFISAVWRNVRASREPASKAGFRRRQLGDIGGRRIYDA